MTVPFHDQALSVGPISQQTVEFSLLDHVPVPLMAIDSVGTQIFVNQAFCRLAGWSAAELIGEKPPFKYWSKLHLNEISTAVAGLVNEGIAREGVEFSMQNRSGEIFSVRMNIAPIQRQGQTVGAIAAITELSEEIRQKRQLAMHEMRFRAITEHIDEVFYLADNGSGSILYISPSYERVWGASRDSLYANPNSYIDAIDAEDRSRAIESLDRQRMGETTRLEYRIRRPDGQIRWIDDQSFTFQEGGNCWTAGLAADITDRKAVESALRRSHEMLNIAQEVAELGSWSIDPSRQTCALTAGVFRILGHQLAEDNERAPYLVKLDAEDFMSMFSSRVDATEMKRVRDFMSGDGEIEIAILLASGKTRKVLLRNRVAIAECGREGSISGVIQDITEFHEKNEQIAQLQKMDGMGKLSGGLAHDLNNILNIVISNLDDIPATNASPYSRHDNLHAALVAAKRGSDLVQSLLVFARSRTSGESRYTLIDEHIMDFLPMVRFVLGPRISIETRLDAAGCVAKFDAAMMDCSILNLVINARDAMPDGGKLVIATARHPAPGMAGFAASGVLDYVEISFQDNGTGMTTEVLARALEPYYTTKRKGTGTGLGLNMVDDYTKANGGTLRLTSELAVGTRISLLLPASPTLLPEQAASDSAHTQAPTRPVPGRIILIVDDETGLQRITKRVLEKRGHEVHTAGSVEQARELLGKHAVQVLVTDIIMPGTQDGTALALWTRHHFPHVGIIGMSGNAELSEEFERHGGLFLRKPVLNARLIEAVESLHVAYKA